MSRCNFFDNIPNYTLVNNIPLIVTDYCVRIKFILLVILHTLYSCPLLLMAREYINWNQNYFNRSNAFHFRYFPTGKEGVTQTKRLTVSNKPFITAVYPFGDSGMKRQESSEESKKWSPYTFPYSK